MGGGVQMEGGADLHLGAGARGRHRNEGCTIKSQMGGPRGTPWYEWRAMITRPIVTPLGWDVEVVHPFHFSFHHNGLI